MPSVRLPVTFVHYVKTNKDTFEIFFHRRVATPLWVFLYQTAWRYSERNPHNAGVECKWGRLKSKNQRLSDLAINNCCTVVCISHFAAGFLFTAGIGRPSAIDAVLCTVRDRPSAVSRCARSLWTWIVCVMYDSKARRYAEDNRTESNCMHW